MTDPLLKVLNSSGNTLAQNDDGGRGLESKVEYTAVSTGFIFIEAGSFGSNGFGTYQFYVTITSVAYISPVAGDDFVSATAGQPITINIGGNDRDSDGDRLTTSGLTNPGQGSVSYTNNSTSPDTVTYTPFFSASGTDRFTYQVSDGRGGTDTATADYYTHQPQQTNREV